jgi:hypothetical protein
MVNLNRQNRLFFLTFLIFVIFLSGCQSSDMAIQIAIKKTQLASPSNTPTANLQSYMVKFSPVWENFKLDFVDFGEVIGKPSDDIYLLNSTDWRSELRGKIEKLKISSKELRSIKPVPEEAMIMDGYLNSLADELDLLISNVNIFLEDPWNNSLDEVSKDFDKIDIISNKIFQEEEKLSKMNPDEPISLSDSSSSSQTTDSLEYKLQIYSFIDERYKYYDALGGDYSGDKYSDQIFQEAADKFRVSVEFVDSVWGDLDVAQAFWEKSSEQPSPSSSSLNSGSSSSSSGNIVTLNMDGVEILCGISEPDYKDIIDALVDKDDSKFNSLLLNGNVILIESGTKAEILKLGYSTAKVRIVEGSNINLVCYTAIEAVQ